MKFVILEPDPIVMMDLQGLLQERFAGAHLVAGATWTDVAAAIRSSDEASAIIVRGSLIAADPDLQAELHARAVRRTRIMVIGPATDFGFPAVFVDLPFSTEILIEALRSGSGEVDIRITP